VVPDVEYVYSLSRLIDKIDYAIDVRLASKEELAEGWVFGSLRISFWQFA